MTDPRHDQFAEAAAAYVLGVLEPAEREAFGAHLGECEMCRADVEAFRRVAASIGATVSRVPPPAELKSSVIARATSGARPFERPVVTSPPSPRSSIWLAAAASLALHAGVGFYAWSLHARLGESRQVAADASVRAETLRSQLAAARGESARASRILEVLTAPDVVRVVLTSTNAGSPGQGLGYWSPSKGVWFAADGLPVPAAGRAYQLWVVLPNRKPLSAGLLAVDARGQGRMLSINGTSVPVAKSSPITLAITDEPAGGSPGPTTPILIAGRAKTD